MRDIWVHNFKVLCILNLQEVAVIYSLQNLSESRTFIGGTPLGPTPQNTLWEKLV